MKLAACQTPDIRNDVSAACLLIEEFATEAQQRGANLICFPECFLQGYTSDPAACNEIAIDITSPAFKAILRSLSAIDAVMVVGLIERSGGLLYNSAVVVEKGAVTGCYRKVCLLDGERSAFAAGNAFPTFEVRGMRFGINICNDLNYPHPASKVASAGARLLVCPANNMMRRAVAEEWKTLHNIIRAERARQTGMWLLSSDVTGERDGRVSYGPTAIIDPDGRVRSQLPLLTSGTLVFDME